MRDVGHTTFVVAASNLRTVIADVEADVGAVRTGRRPVLALVALAAAMSKQQLIDMILLALDAATAAAYVSRWIGVVVDGDQLAAFDRNAYRVVRLTLEAATVFDMQIIDLPAAEVSVGIAACLTQPLRRIVTYRDKVAAGNRMVQLMVNVDTLLDVIRTAGAASSALAEFCKVHGVAAAAPIDRWLDANLRQVGPRY